MYDEAPVRVRGGSVILQITGGDPNTGIYLEWEQVSADGREWLVRGTQEYAYVIEVEQGPHKKLKITKPKATVTVRGERLTFSSSSREDLTRVVSTVELHRSPHDARILFADGGGAAFTEVTWHDEPETLA